MAPLIKALQGEVSRKERARLENAYMVVKMGAKFMRGISNLLSMFNK